MIKDIFERIKETPGPLGQYQGIGDGYFMFPRLVGEIGPEMEFNGKPVLNWSLNNYLGLANHMPRQPPSSVLEHPWAPA